MTKDNFKRANDLINFYQSQYKKKFGKNEPLNRNKLQYSIVNMLYDFSEDDAKKLIMFYIKTDKEPKLQKFCFEYDEIYDQMQMQNNDRELRISLMHDTEASVREYMKRYGNEK